MDRYTTLARRLQERCPQLELREYEPMSRHTSFRIGGPARLMALPRSREEAVRAVQAAMELGIRPFYLGNGSNLLVADRGYEGFILKTGGMDQVREVNRRLAGLEFAHGIPGSLGGAVTMNAGAYGGEMVQVLTAVTFLDGEGHVVTLPVEACRLTYRHSDFTEHPERLILEAEFELRQGDGSESRAKMEELARRRKEKQPLEYPSAGSTFKRPEGYFAAALIEQCGLKGRRVGGAQVSEKHAGFVINRGDATCADVLALVEEIRAAVFRETGVTLELEVRTLGL